MRRSSEEDRRLLSRCLSGDRRASEALVRQFSDQVYRSVQYALLVKHVLFNRHDLEDLHNTVFLLLFEHGCKKLRQYQGKNGLSLASWIRMIAVRTVLDHLRKRGIDTMVWQKARIPLEKLPELKAKDTEFDAPIERAEQERVLQIGIQRLAPRDRLFIKLHFNQGLSVAEVAEVMQLSIGNAYTIKHRAIQRLKSHLASVTNTDS
jgi:RNA polymerase sigma factor (sigma-70 family)